ncbi:MAG: hypothetical protein LQ351_005182 [Letrouitia transgressa]|nr:MAG: hypothetical protein LQ351_005182 [Letrouitia transgressa]
MQSGITASPSLRHAFTALLSDPSHFALLVTIADEQLVPLDSLPAPNNTSSSSLPSSSFQTSLLPLLRPHFLPTRALYILLRLPSTSPSSPSTTDASLAAITYIPPTAPVRQKMLFASTRLALVRDLGPEHFAAQVLATEEDEVMAVGKSEGEGGEEGEKPWSREEEVLGRVRRMEEEETGLGSGTRGRRAHLDLDEEGGKGMVVEEGARGELRGLRDGGRGLVMLRINDKEALELAGTADADARGLSEAISGTEPRYSFFRHEWSVEGETKRDIVFIYTCPPGSKVKERMVYATMKRWACKAASEAGGFEVAKRLEASSPEEITAEVIEEEFQPKQEVKQGFSKPKRPGRR